MNGFWNAVRGQAAMMGRQAGVLRWGLVTSVDPVLYRVKVQVQPEGLQTDWLPILSHSAGNGWSMLMLPDIGQQAALMADSGDGGHLVVTGFAHSTASPPPVLPDAIGTGGTPNATTAPNVAGELVIQNKAGAALRLCADGSIYLRGNLNVDGTLRVNGEIYDRHSMLDVLRQAYNAHLHGGVMPGAGDTGTTTIPVSE